MKHVFDLAYQLLSGDQVGQIWVVYGVAGGQPPTVVTLETKDDLCDLISELRAKHNSRAHDGDYYIHIFFGQRWQIQKGREWQLYDGASLTPIVGGRVAELLDATGGLGDNVDMDDIVATPTTPAEPEPVDEPPAAVSPAAPMLGEEPEDDDDLDEDPEIT